MKRISCTSPSLGFASALLLCLASTTVSLAATGVELGPKLEVWREGATTPDFYDERAVVAWGDNRKGQTNVPLNLNDAIAVAAGGSHSLALKKNGTVVAWGDNTAGQTTVPVGLTGVKSIAAGRDFSLAIRTDGSVVGWGNNSDGQISPPPGLTDVTSLAAGYAHTVALKSDGTLVAWGQNSDQYRQTTIPSGLPNVDAISAAGYRTLALTRNRTVVGWGGYSGQVRTPSSDGSKSFYIPPGSGLIAVAAGVHHNLVIKGGGGGVAGWGSDGRFISPMPGSMGAPMAVAAGAAHSVVIGEDGDIIAWGANYSGSTSVPPGLQQVIAVAAGDYHTLALRGGNPLILDPVEMGSSVETTILLKSVGAGAVYELSASIHSSYSDDYSIVSEPVPSILGPGQSIAVKVRFTARRPGYHHGSLRITSNDPTLLSHTVPVMATVLAPEIGVSAQTGSGSETSIPIGGSLAVGTAVMGTAPLTRSFFVTNTGKTAIEDLAFSITGDHAADFSIDSQGITTVAPGIKQTFTLSFQPSAAGLRTATLRIANNDFDENPYDIVLSGEGTGIAIGLAGDPASVFTRPAQEIDLGWADSGTVVSRSLTIRNTSAQVMTGLRLEITGADARSVQVQPVLPSQLAAGESATFTISFPLTLGGYNRDTTIRLLTDSPHESPVSLVFKVNVNAPALTLVDEYGRSLGSPPAINFGSTPFSTPRAIPITLKNKGDLALTIHNFTIDGPGADQFLLQDPLPASLQSWPDFKSFIHFKPTRIGQQVARLKISSNDPTAPDYFVFLGGIGVYDAAATKPNVPGSIFTASTPVADRLTSNTIQTIIFSNPTQETLPGLSVTVSNLPTGVPILSSSWHSHSTGQNATLEVIYSKPIAPGETVKFTLTYLNPKRRILRPEIHVFSLFRHETRIGPQIGTLVRILGIRDTPSGPLLIWAAKRGEIYNVEYSDDAGLTWYSAEHLLGTRSRHLLWVDRGQPETYTKPANKAARSYRVRRL